MTDQFISFETAKLAKEKGIDARICGRVYVGNSKWEERIPTQSLLQKWLRENHKIHIQPYLSWDIKTWGYRLHFLNVEDVYEEASKRIFHIAKWKSYEEALEVGLQEALQLITK